MKRHSSGEEENGGPKSSPTAPTASSSQPVPKKMIAGMISESEIDTLVKNNTFRCFARKVKPSMVDLQVMAGQEASFVTIPEDCHPQMKLALPQLGFDRLYSHQVRCRNLVREGKNVIITTPTSSGKSLCFNFAILDQLFLDPDATAMYLYPLNALAIDQQNKLTQMNQKLTPKLNIAMITGKATEEERKRALASQANLRVLMTNPDFLHWQLYRGGKKYSEWPVWRDFLKRLRFVVLDEAHTYNGVMGANVTNVIRRLYAQIDDCGGDPDRVQFILASATVKNGYAMACKLTSKKEFAHISTSGAACAEKTVITLEPCVDPAKKTGEVISHWISLGLRGIIFCHAVQSTMSLVDYLNNTIEFKPIARRVRAYYSAIQEKDKSEILADLKRGAISVIISTSALEAGVDIAELDAVMLYTFPGSRMSFLQRIGRAGRGKQGLAVFLPKKSLPMDMYYAQHPHLMTNKSVESVAFNQDYPAILKRHLLCAAAERGLFTDPEWLTERYGPIALDLVKQMEQANELYISSARYGNNWSPQMESIPHFSVSLRGGSGQRTTVAVRVIEETGRTTDIEECGLEQRAKTSRPDKFVVQKLTIDPVAGNVALLWKRDLPSFTTRRVAKVESKIQLQTEWGRKCYLLDGYPNAQLQLAYGYGTVQTQLVGYAEYKKERNTDPDAVSGAPSSETIYDTPFSYMHQAPVLQIAFTPAALELLKRKASGRILATDTATPAEIVMHTILHQLMNVVPLLLLSQNEVRESPPKLAVGEGYLADAFDGGTGVCEAIFENFEEFWQKASEMSRGCADCGGAKGCPSCLYINNCCQWNQSLCAAVGCGHLEISLHRGEAIVVPSQTPPAKKIAKHEDKTSSQGVVVTEASVEFQSECVEEEEDDEDEEEVEENESSPLSVTSSPLLHSSQPLVPAPAVTSPAAPTSHLISPSAVTPSSLSKKKRSRSEEEEEADAVNTARLFSTLVRLRESLTRERGGGDIALLSNTSLLLLANTRPRSLTELNAIETLSSLPQDLKTALLQCLSMFAWSAADKSRNLTELARNPTPLKLQHHCEFETRRRSVEEIAELTGVQPSTVRSYLAHAALWGHEIQWRRTGLTAEHHERISSVLNRIGCDETLGVIRAECGETDLEYGIVSLSRARYLLENELAPVTTAPLPPLPFSSSSIGDEEEALDERQNEDDLGEDVEAAEEGNGVVVAPFGLNSPTV